jgi:pyruvate dehydrogenase E2 component (dihydrolipoamide acetyltransferase)
MATEVKLPDLGEGVDSAEVINIMVDVGDEVQAEQTIMEIETDKASVEVPSSSAGKVAKVHIDVGQTVSTGDVLLTLEAAEGGADQPEEDKQAEAVESEQAAEEAEPAEKQAEEKQEPAEAEKKPKAEKEEAPAEEPAESKEDEQPEAEPEKAGPSATAPSVSTAGDDIAASPSVRKLARQLGVDLRRVKGSGGGGRITQDDLYAAVRDHNIGDGLSGEPTALQASAEPSAAGKDTGDQDNWGPVRRERISKVRATIARKMHESWTTLPHVTHFDEADITELEEFRQERKGDLGEDVKLTLMPFVIRAVVEALKQHPKVNASLDLDAGEVIYHDYVSIGIAVDTDRGLVVPVLRNAEGKGIARLAKDISDLAGRTREGDFAVEDLRGGTFTISNQGAIGGAYATPIINHPESAILLLGRGGLLPRVHDDEIQPRLILPLSFSYDHRLIDGADAGRFINTLKDLLQRPGKLLLSL